MIDAFRFITTVADSKCGLITIQNNKITTKTKKGYFEAAIDLDGLEHVHTFPAIFFHSIAFMTGLHNVRITEGVRFLTFNFGDIALTLSTFAMDSSKEFEKEPTNWIEVQKRALHTSQTFVTRIESKDDKFSFNNTQIESISDIETKWYIEAQTWYLEKFIRHSYEIVRINYKNKVLMLQSGNIKMQLKGY